MQAVAERSGNENILGPFCVTKTSSQVRYYSLYLAVYTQKLLLFSRAEHDYRISEVMWENFV